MIISTIYTEKKIIKKRIAFIIKNKTFLKVNQLMMLGLKALIFLPKVGVIITSLITSSSQYSKNCPIVCSSLTLSLTKTYETTFAHHTKPTSKCSFLQLSKLTFMSLQAFKILFNTKSKTLSSNAKCSSFFSSSPYGFTQ